MADMGNMGDMGDMGMSDSCKPSGSWMPPAEWRLGLGRGGKGGGWVRGRVDMDDAR